MAGKYLDLTGLGHFKDKLSSEVDTKIEAMPAVKIVYSGEGFRALSNGRIEQWGTAYIANGDGTRVVFPVTFPNKVEDIQCTPIEGVAVSVSATVDGGRGAATIKHNGNGGVQVRWNAEGR